MSSKTPPIPWAAAAVSGRSTTAAAQPPVPGYAVATLAGLAAITLARLLWLAVQPADLYPDEAQYWFWAQHPALGYYSKPPLIAWLIALTTRAFGDSEFAIRLSAPLLHTCVAALVYLIGARLYDRRIGFWSALGYASLPGVSVSAFIISTDAALLPFWAAALYAFIRAREHDSRFWWAAVGLAAGFGLLAKYAMAYWLLSALGFVLVVRSERRHLPALPGAAAVAVLIYLPNFWWNWSHRFVSYLHVRDNADLAAAPLHPGAFLEFLGSQFGVFGPLFFAGLLAVTLTGAAFREPRARLLAIFSLPILAMMLAVSLLSHAEPNWAAPTYVSGIVLVVAWALERGWRTAIAFSIGVNLVLAAAVFGGGGALAAAGVPLPAKSDPLHRLRGWRTLGRTVGASLAAHPDLTLVADDRELLAALIYYVDPHPWSALKWNPMRLVKDQWDLTDDLAHHAGQSFLVVTEHYGIDDLRRSFAEVDLADTVVVSPGADGSRTYRFYVARRFLFYPWDRR
jgi:4-amino-4-deoxy-L-arabinose transferase-like glycosyltransferase